MTLRGAASIVGAFEHPLREIPDSTLAEIHADVALGALADAGLTLADVDAYFCDGEAPGLGPLSMAEYLGLRCRYADSTEIGGSSYLSHVGHAAAAIAAGKCDVALITLAGKPRTGGASPGGTGRSARRPKPTSSCCGERRSPPSTRWPPDGTCTSSAPRAPSWPRSRSPPRCTRSTTPTPSSATRSRSRRCSRRRSSPTRCTVSTAASSPTAVVRSSSSGPRSRATSGAGARRCSATARR